MSRTAEVEKVAMLVQIGGKMFQVALPQDRMRLLVNMAASLSDTGSLPVMPAPESVAFEIKENPRK